MVTVVPAVAPRAITARIPVGFAVRPECSSSMAAWNPAAACASRPAGRACRLAGRVTTASAVMAAGSELGDTTGLPRGGDDGGEVGPGRRGDGGADRALDERRVD